MFTVTVLLLQTWPLFMVTVLLFQTWPIFTVTVLLLQTWPLFTVNVLLFETWPLFTVTVLLFETWTLFTVTVLLFETWPLNTVTMLLFETWPLFRVTVLLFQTWPLFSYCATISEQFLCYYLRHGHSLRVYQYLQNLYNFSHYHNFHTNIRPIWDMANIWSFYISTNLLFETWPNIYTISIVNFWVILSCNFGRIYWPENSGNIFLCNTGNDLLNYKV
jgi:hypothetical protein